MKKVLFLIVLSIFIFSCDGEDGTDGVMGPAGAKGCDSLTEVYDKELGFCRAYTDAEQTLINAEIKGNPDLHPDNHEKFVTGDNCDDGKIWNSVEGSCDQG